MCFSRVVASSPSFSRHAARVYSEATCRMAHDAVGQEKQRDYVIQKLSYCPFFSRSHCVVCPPARCFCTMKPFRAKGTLELQSWKKKCWDTLNVSRYKLMKMSATLKFTPLPFKSADFQLHKVVLSSELFKQQLATVIRSKTLFVCGLYIVVQLHYC